MLERFFKAILGDDVAAWLLGPSCRSTAWGIVAAIATMIATSPELFPHHEYLLWICRGIAGGTIVKAFRETSDFSKKPTVPLPSNMSQK